MRSSFEAVSFWPFLVIRCRIVAPRCFQINRPYSTQAVLWSRDSQSEQFQLLPCYYQASIRFRSYSCSSMRKGGAFFPKQTHDVFNVALAFSVLSIKCYVCQDCGDSNGKETDCDAGFDRCMKGDATLSDKRRISRSCANKDVCDAAEKVCDALKECTMDCCDSDLCNAGAAPSFSVLLVSLCSLVAVVPFFKWGPTPQEETARRRLRFSPQWHVFQCCICVSHTHEVSSYFWKIKAHWDSQVSYDRERGTGREHELVSLKVPFLSGAQIFNKSKYVLAITHIWDFAWCVGSRVLWEESVFRETYFLQFRIVNSRLEHLHNSRNIWKFNLLSLRAALCKYRESGARSENSNSPVMLPEGTF